ncbi:putative blue light photoreceptor, partial [Mycena maculata]
MAPYNLGAVLGPPPLGSATSTIQFQLPEYLYDAPPTLAPGGGAEALHPAVAATWFANSGFRAMGRYPAQDAVEPEEQSEGRGVGAVADAWNSLTTLHDHFAAMPIARSGLATGTTSELASWDNTNTSSNNITSISNLSKNSTSNRPTSSGSEASDHGWTPSPLTGALPVYSQSGFDVVSLLARVQNRREKRVQLGPIDFTTSFVVVDVRRHDAPIVYCSPSFCALTGYGEREVVGRNCRFLQTPPPSATVPPLVRGSPRTHTSAPAVRALAKAVSAGKEAQVSLVNYRRDGGAFVNLVSVVPLRGEFVDEEDGYESEYGCKGGEVVWYVGFQVDLGRQSEGIVERVREGRYYKGAVVAAAQGITTAATTTTALAKAKDRPEGAPAPRERRSTAVPPPKVSPVLARLLANPRFLASCGIHVPLNGFAPTSEAGGVLGSGGAGTGAEYQAVQECKGGGGLPPDPASHALHCLLLQELPDFVHVLSLKGAFLYVAPAVTRVLGWAPAELVGRAVADVCFKKDVVAVGRALKEASLPVEGVGAESGKGPTTTADALRPVDLVFRALTKSGAWVWVECRGRLHVEPGKGRKAIVLVGRARAMARVGEGEMPVMSAPRMSPDGQTQTYAGGWAPPLKRARMEEGISGALGSPQALMSPRASPPAGISAATPTAFHGLLDPHGLLISVGAGAPAVLGWEPLALRGTRLGALVVPDTRLSAAGSPNAVDG